MNHTKVDDMNMFANRKKFNISNDYKGTGKCILYAYVRQQCSTQDYLQET